MNITPSSSGEGLKAELEMEAAKRGMKLRPFVQQIYIFAVQHRDSFTGALTPTRPTPGDHIGTSVPDDVAAKLAIWAKDENISRGSLCNYILQQAMQDGLLATIFDSQNQDEQTTTSRLIAEAKMDLAYRKPDPARRATDLAPGGGPAAPDPGARGRPPAAKPVATPPHTTSVGLAVELAGDDALARTLECEYIEETPEGESLFWVEVGEEVAVRAAIALPKSAPPMVRDRRYLWSPREGTIVAAGEGPGEPEDREWLDELGEFESRFVAALAELKPEEAERQRAGGE